MESTNYIVTINTYFSMIRLNSNIKQYSDMTTEYRNIIRIICDDYLPKQKKYELKGDIEDKIMKLNDNKDQKYIFDALQVDADDEELVFNLTLSIKNMRKKIAVDLTDKKIVKKANEIKRQSFLNDIEYKYVFALNYEVYPVDEQSQYFKVIQQYVTEFYDVFDVIGDCYTYFKLFGKEESRAIRQTTRAQVEKLESEYDH